MQADGADEIENEVVYMEESVSRRSMAALRAPPARPRDAAAGPSKRIFGWTPSEIDAPMQPTAHLLKVRDRVKALE